MDNVAFTWARRALGLGLVLTLIFSGYTLVNQPGSLADQIFTKGVYNAVLLIGAAVMLVRGALLRRERAAWLLLGLGLLLWTSANTYYSLFVAHLDPVPIPSVADGLWLAFYPPAYLGLILLVRSRLSGLRRGMWLDGLIGALAVGAAMAAVVVDVTLRAGLVGSPVEIATNLAYPVSDLVLVGATVLVLALNGWRLGATWRLLGGGFLIFAVSDAIYFWQVAEGTFVAGAPLDIGWPVAALMLGAAALTASPPRQPSRNDGHRALIVPALFGLVGLGLLVWGNRRGLNDLALILATCCVAGVVLRMSLTFAQSRAESMTDALTGLPNRRRLARDLAELAPQASEARPLGLVIFDLNGFKSYNDRFGHPAGDALLRRLSGRLTAALGDGGTAYRMGGDEFCALLTPGRGGTDALVARALAALREEGAGFRLEAAHGLVELPRDCLDADDALKTADQRMYARKHSSRVPADRQAGDVLVNLLEERQPGLGGHGDGVAELAMATGRGMGLDDRELSALGLAARLHDVGKAAVPDAVLNKPGPLDAEEWRLVRRHAAVGERILRAAPALEGVARAVGASHERWDGTGYPDGLAGSDIPLAARIVAVCDAFDAIIGERPYAARRTPEQALEELRRHAGTQFDPDVVEAFLTAWAARAAAPAGVAGALPSPAVPGLYSSRGQGDDLGARRPARADRP